MDHTNPIDAPPIDERDQLIDVLTQQLEYAAEQLDRYQRAGAQPASALSRGASSGLPPDLAEGLAHFLEQWDQMQAGFTLGRIEVQLEEIKDLIFRYGDRASDSVPVDDVSAILSSITGKSNSGSEDKIPLSELGSWEKIKSSLLGQNLEETEELQTDSKDDSPAQQKFSIDQSQVIDLLGLELPPLVDFDNADSDELADAIQSRDEIISILLDRIGQLHQEATSSVDTESLSGFEDEKAVINTLQNRLTEQLKVAELHNSLERARLSREKVKLQQKEMMIEKKLLQLGLTSTLNSNAEESKEASKNKTDSKRGWLRR